MTSLLSVFAGFGWLAFGLMAWRLSGVKRDRDKADIARKEQAKELLTATKEYETYRDRTQAQLKDLRNEIINLETELEQSATPGSRRDALNRLLQKASGAGKNSTD